METAAIVLELFCTALLVTLYVLSDDDDNDDNDDGMYQPIANFW